MNTTNWKKFNLEYGKDVLNIKIPPYCDILTMGYVPALEESKDKIEDALSNPIGTLSIEDIITSHKKQSSQVTVAVAVSDNTRPVPYNAKSEEGILYPLLKRFEKAGVKTKNIKIIIATGTHTPTSQGWKKEAFGELITNKYHIVDHDSTSSDLFSIGEIEGIQVKINRQFIEADIHVITGLVEPHLMVGVSGGRKAVCPGLINLQATYLFHGVEIMDNPNAVNLVLKNNPCHEFALKVAHKARVDFSLNVTINGSEKLTGVFAGDLEKAHLEAVKKLREYAVVPCRHEYDIILTSGGKVAVNHYQAAKAVHGTIPAIKKEGIVILAAHNTDEEPIGKDEYKKILRVLQEKGPGKFTQFIKGKSWQFIPDQWQVQIWDQFFRKVGSFNNLIYCTHNIPSDDLRKLPGKSGYDFLEGENVNSGEMVQNALFYAIGELEKKLKRNLKIAVVKEGPYVVLEQERNKNNTSS